jgi:imidazolonepropionase-like amidohydrolase
VLDAGTRALELAYHAGVPLVYGTDLLGAMHKYQLNEMSLRAEVASNADVIRSATCNAALAFKREGEFGVIKAGARADLIALAGNPLDDLQVLQAPDDHLKLVMKEGTVYKQDF